MGKNNDTKKKVSKTSSGKRRMQKASRERGRCEMKIARWDRYRKEIAEGKRAGDPKRWDTSGLQKRITALDGIIKAGITYKL